MKIHRNGNTALLLLAAVIVALASEPTWAAATTVYKCFDKNLGVLYTDEPCKGEQMNIRAGEADPIAIAELQREREALSRSAAQRIADNRRAALEREYVAQGAYGPPQVLPAYSDADGYYSGYGVYPYSTAQRGRHPMRDPRRQDRDRERDRERVVINPPRSLPRR
jgi:hypothetical protein